MRWKTLGRAPEEVERDSCSRVEVGTMGRLAIGGVVGAVMGGIVGGVSGSVLVGSVVAMVCGVVPIVFKSVMPTVVRGVVVTVFRGVTVDVVAEGLFWVICLGFVGACIVGVVAVFTMGAIIGKVVGIGAVVGGAVVGGAVGAVIWNIVLDAGDEPQRRRRGATAVDSNTVYVAQGYGHCVWAYDPKGNVWTRLPDCPQRRAGLAIVNGLLTAVGGETYDGIPTPTLVSLTGSHWTQHFPPMPVTPYNLIKLLYAPAVVCTGKHLVVVLRRDSRVHGYHFPEVVHCQQAAISSFEAITHSVWDRAVCAGFQEKSHQLFPTYPTSVLVCSIPKDH